MLFASSIAAYKEMEYNAEADSLARRFYQKDPFYKPQYYDPASFTEILGNYYTMPKFSVWLAYSRPSVAVRLDTVYVITIDTLQRKPDYEYNTNAVQLGFEYHPLKFLSVSVAPTFTYYKYTRSIRRHEFAMHYYKERYSVFSLPVRVEAGWYGKKSEKKKVTVVPSLFAGVQPKYVINSNYQIYTDIIGQIVNIPDEQSNVSVKNRFNYALFYGARLSINHRRLTYFAEWGVSSDMLPVNNPDKKTDNLDAVFRELYINDVYRTVDHTLTLGIKVNLQYKTVAKNGYGYN